MITFEQIQKANEGLKAIDVKGKKYVMVNEKVKAFRMLYPEGFIHTDLLSLENGIAVMQSKAGFFENGQERILGTGMAFERQDSSFINKTSYIENCETSAIGRALSFLGLGMDDSIASAEELANAILNQKKDEDVPNNPPGKPFTPPKASANASVSSAPGKIPEKKDNPVKKYVDSQLTLMKEMYGIADTDEVIKRFKEMRQSLIDGGVIPDIKGEDQTIEDAEQMFSAIFANFRPSGEAV